MFNITKVIVGIPFGIFIREFNDKLICLIISPPGKKQDMSTIPIYIFEVRSNSVLVRLRLDSVNVYFTDLGVLLY